MGSSTQNAFENIMNARSIGDFLANNDENMIGSTLSEHLMELLKQKGIKRADVVRDSGLEKAYVYQIFNGEKKPSRDKLIAIAFGLHLNTEEMQRMLKLGGCSELYARLGRDAVILFAVNKEMDIIQTDELLYANGFDTLLDKD